VKDEVRRISKTIPGVAELEKCFIRKMGFKYYVDLHVMVDGRISVTDGHRIGHEVEAAILALQPESAQGGHENVIEHCRHAAGGLRGHLVPARHQRAPWQFHDRTDQLGGPRRDRDSQLSVAGR
jgi:hypothetical protein